MLRYAANRQKHKHTQPRRKPCSTFWRKALKNKVYFGVHLQTRSSFSCQDQQIYRLFWCRESILVISMALQECVWTLMAQRKSHSHRSRRKTAQFTNLPRPPQYLFKTMASLNRLTCKYTSTLWQCSQMHIIYMLTRTLKGFQRWMWFRQHFHVWVLKIKHEASLGISKRFSVWWFDEG